MRIRLRWLILLALAHGGMVLGADSPESVPAGHSVHGEAFNEGPRAAAELIPGLPKLHFPTSSESAQAQAFIEQGVAQLHGFWYLEAERSFRQAATEDPDLAIAYWGMAMANTNNASRARGLIDQAMKLRKDHADRREKLYIEALDRYLPPKKEDKAGELDEADKKDDKTDKELADEREAKQKRTERFIADWEEIVLEFPNDLEAKAFLVVTIWSGNRSGVKLTSHLAVDALMDQIFAEDPMHPSHHYRIHLWDSKRPAKALASAAACGPSSPAIAHMWHMPGHIYSKLKRYNDAAWQQEASARVDHSHMIRSRLLPDQIHNFAHNNEWLVRNLLYVGRVDDALDLSLNLVSLPRHPEYNTLQRGGSFRYGRQRLIQTLSQYGLWDRFLEASIGEQFHSSDRPEQQDEWLGWVSVAHFKSAQNREGARVLRSLQRRRLAIQGELLDLAEAEAGSNQDSEQSDTLDDDKRETEAAAEPDRDKLKDRLGTIKKAISLAVAARASERSDVKTLNQHADVAKLDSVIRAQWLADAGDREAAIKLARKAVRDGAGQVRPLAVLVEVLWHDGKEDEAKKEFEKLRSVASVANLDTPMLARLAPVALACDVEEDWRVVGDPPSDLGERPPLNDLGPFRWQPWTSPSWEAKTSDGSSVASEAFDGKSRIMVFYLGFGCLHCIEQLHALQPHADRFGKLGIDLVALSTESVDELKMGLANFDKPMSIPLLSDTEHQVFDAFGCWDDFENQPLHGTFLIDSRGRVRWQDVGHEPFMDVEFLLEESERLLAMPVER